ncbi:MAG: MinD/ParA family protein [Candidatus Manganitrophaceae bacterium]|nr:MAG: MinD/ParA family protein [Candidatus Manganitrophaceae bacterium]
MDQARTLRKWADGASDAPRQPRVIAVTSGKGGVGKTNVVANLAVAFSQLGQRVLVLDADLGLGNVDVLFGIIPPYTLEHVLSGQKSISEIMIDGPAGIRILPTSSGTEEMTHLTAEQKLILLSELDRLEEEIDVFLIDTAAGISSNVIYFNTVAQEILVVATPEPTSVTDAYAIMKVLCRQHDEKRFNLLVNMVRGEQEGRDIFKKLSMVADQFLGVAIDYIGAVPFDDYLRMAVCQQKTVVERFPSSRSSLRFTELARDILQRPLNSTPKGNVQFLWKALLSRGSGPPPTSSIGERGA